MNVLSASLEEIRQRMGADSTTEDAERMLSILRVTGVCDTDELSDPEWFALAASCAE